MAQLSKLYLEHGQFLEIAGDHYCTRESCEGCPHANICQHDEQETYTDFTPPVRSVIRTNGTSKPYSPYPQDINDTPDEVRRFKGNILPNSHKRVFKVVTSHPAIDATDHIIYQAPTDKYYCLQQHCKGCKFNTQCKRELELIDDDHDLVMVIDFKNQEPRTYALTVLTTGNREYVWDDVFRNDSIRDQRQVYETLANLFRYHHIDTSVKNIKFNEWVATRFFDDRTPLYKLQTAVFNHYRDKSQDTLDKLKSIAHEILKDYEDYSIRLKANKRN